MAGKIVVLGTGGTIAGTGDAAGASVGYTAAQLGIDQLLAAVPQLAQAARGPLLAEQVAQIDSKDMSHAVWTRLLARCLAHLEDDEVAGIVITHGTDTLEETAWLLHNLLPAHKPVVLTCAMRPATALAPDGPQNLLDAVALAAEPTARGVLMVAAGVVHGAREVTKVHPLRLDAFASHDGGPLGWMEAGRVRWAHGCAPAGQEPRHGALAARLAQGGAQWPRVAIVLSHAGVDGSVVDALVAAAVDGLVAAATGNGTLHETLHAALMRAEQAGVAIRMASRCPQGRMLPQSDLAWADAQGLSPVKARISLMLELMEGAKG
ncbi:asparaginase [Melaminivora suipulveris]|uniref:Asparaginase n=1 Tax=Melaminivora suipulveris TaxID=2109913 RepID=A0A2R3Q8J5_9BURK|nr:asparaginase [Melaminivora suipulveris]AVO48106.1 asparaginase [Melaminivora suipulveris]